jgi:hypothetical protein
MPFPEVTVDTVDTVHLYNFILGESRCTSLELRQNPRKIVDHDPGPRSKRHCSTGMIPLRRDSASMRGFVFRMPAKAQPRKTPAARPICALRANI